MLLELISNAFGSLSFMSMSDTLDIASDCESKCSGFKDPATVYEYVSEEGQSTSEYEPSSPDNRTETELTENMITSLRKSMNMPKI